MTRNFAGNSSCSCGACNASLSRRQFLCTTAAGAAAASAMVATVAGPAGAQQPGGATAPGRAILIKGGCVLTLDRTVGDFEQADEVIDASRMIVAPGFVDTHRHMWQGILRNVLPDGSLDDYIATVQKTFGAKYV